MNALVDTSVWSLLLRRMPKDLNAGQRTIVAEMADLVREGRARIIGMVRQELLSGLKTPQQYEKLRAALRAFADEPVDMTDHEGAAKAANDCKARGVTMSPVDALICEVALARQWAVFTADSDFEKYSKVLPLTLHTPRA